MFLLRLILLIGWVSRRIWSYYSYTVITGSEPVTIYGYTIATNGLTLSKPYLYAWVANEAVSAASDITLIIVAQEILKHGFYSMF